MREPGRTIAAAVATLCAQVTAAADWQCATIGVGAAPTIAEAASGYLERAGEIYPSQLLGVVQSGGRVYLVNAKDGGWSERVRLGLMELRLAEPDITAARRFQGTVSGAVPMEIPTGDYACLARERAGRQGLALDGRGRMSLAPGKSVYLVDPREWSVVVEVKAIGAEPLDFREILALSGRSGIYAGLTGRRARSSRDNAVEGTGGVIEVAVGPSGSPGGEVVITPRSGVSEQKAATIAATEMPVMPPAPALAVVAPVVVAAPPAVIALADVPAVPPPQPLPSPQAPMTVVPVVIAEPPVQVAKADVPNSLAVVPAAPPSVQPSSTTAAVAEPVSPVVTLPRASAMQPTRSGATQSYDEYAKAMKSMLALKRSGVVRSVSEMTYVHPAIEDLRNIR
jgi:hypothetical protein